MWDDIAPSDSTPIRFRYYCTRCEDFFELSPMAPGICPMCFCDARYIIGPIPVKEYDLNKLIAKQRKKYGDKMRR
jgi:hypothetical protein